ncbi:MAG: Ig-like domain-containing protein, partial [Ginsengibacter sp.]
TTTGTYGSWSSSNTATATVNAATGLVTGVAAGSVTITYTSITPCGTLMASASITVLPIVSAGAVSGSSTLCIGSTTTYTSNGTPGGTWSSLTPSVASVNATTGVVTGVSAGNATIKYTVSGCGGSFSSSKAIAVSAAANPGTISGPSSVCDGSGVNFNRSGGASGGTWSSSNTSVATVNSSGRVTGQGAGTAVISYSVTSGCGTFSATQSVTVSADPTIAVTNITASTDPNSCSALVTLGSNITTTGSPTLEYRIGYFPFFSFPIPSTYRFYRGTTPVIVIASNSCGNAVRAFLVTVVDNTPPTIACVPNATRNVNGSSNRYSVHGHEFDATASDGCGVASLIYSLSGATNDGFDNNNRSLNNVRFNEGTTTVTWRATDVNGNVSTCSFTVTVTHSGSSANPPEDQSQSNAKMELFAAGLTLNAAPNPTSSYFTLSLRSIGTEKIKLNVVDLMGRTIEKITDITPNTTVQIGGKYHPGIYMVQAVQGQQTVVLKLIKEGN